MGRGRSEGEKRFAYMMRNYGPAATAKLVSEAHQRKENAHMRESEHQSHEVAKEITGRLMTEHKHEMNYGSK